MFPLYWSNYDKQRLVIAEETSEERGVKIILFFADGEMATGKNLLVMIGILYVCISCILMTDRYLVN